MLFTLLVSLLPGVAAAAAFAFVVYLLAGAVLVVVRDDRALVVAGECWVAIEGLGRMLDRTDPSAVEAAE